MTYTTQRPFLKNHKVHDFHQSLAKEKKVIESGAHLAVIHQLNIEFEKIGLRIDFDSFADNYGSDSLSQFRNKAGVDVSFDLISIKTGKVVKEGFSLDLKFRDPNAIWDDFLAETVSQDFGVYSKKMPVPGWALCNHKINDAILYILPRHKKAALVMRKELKEGFDQSKFAMKNFKYAKNKGWTTISIAISWERLIKVCPNTIIFNYE